MQIACRPKVKGSLVQLAVELLEKARFAALDVLGEFAAGRLIDDGLPYLVVIEIGPLAGSYEIRWAARLIPNFSMRCLKVFGCMPRVFAAPLDPSMTPCVSCNTAKM